ncbi:MAG: aldo/keto reductase [Theionarchaea archaeon]|nr:aldo/keto reductase [Theionarchaea archaeon]
MPKRPYGDTGENLSIVGFGGITAADHPPSIVEELVLEAMERGVNYFDVAPTYGDAEELLGPILHEYRDEIFLACKTTQRRGNGAASELRSSLRKLQTDRFDLYQLHGIGSMDDVDTIFGKDGAIHAFVEAREEGKIDHIGFSAHSVEAALAAIDRFDFDSVLFPINFVTYLREGFGPQVIEATRERGMACLALKAMAKSKWPQGEMRDEFPKCWYQPASDPELADMALRFTLSQPVVAAIPPGEELLFKMALDIASRFRPIEDREVEELRAIAGEQEPIFTLDL